MTWVRHALIALALTGCQDRQQVHIVMDDPDETNVLEYYLGIYAGGDPTEKELLSSSNGRLRLDVGTLGQLRPGLDSLLLPFAQRGRLSWDSLLAFVQLTYDSVRMMPAELPLSVDRWSSEESVVFEVHGPVTRYLRRIHVHSRALEEALLNYQSNRQKIIYPADTWFIAEHLDGDQLMEITAMYKRPDGFWEFGSYDPTGLRKKSTHPNPRALATPRQCVGCHFGTRLFEPERSFPELATAGPDGIRHWYTDARDPDVTEFFSEHEHRSDAVLGLYATVHVTNLLRARQSDQIDPQGAALLQTLGF